MAGYSGYLKRLAIIFGIVFLIAVIHIFRMGSYLQGELYILYYSYFSDFIIPFGCYFLLCMSEIQIPVLEGGETLMPIPDFLVKNNFIIRIPFISRWEGKLAIAFLIPSIAETCQYFGIPVLGSTFDYLDYLVYGIGAISAVVVDTQIFSRLFNFWNLGQTKKNVTS
jgi:hypothetical protein